MDHAGEDPAGEQMPPGQPPPRRGAEAAAEAAVQDNAGRLIQFLVAQDMVAATTLHKKPNSALVTYRTPAAPGFAPPYEATPYQQIDDILRGTTQMDKCSKIGEKRRPLAITKRPRAAVCEATRHVQARSPKTGGPPAAQRV